MSKIETGGPAFPACNEANVNGTMGMTLRDYFAAQALAGLMAHETIEYLSPNDIAERAYEKADAMIRIRGGDRD